MLLLMLNPTVNLLWRWDVAAEVSFDCYQTARVATATEEDRAAASCTKLEPALFVLKR